MSLLKAKILNFRYDEDNSSVLENIDLEIYEGVVVKQL